MRGSEARLTFERRLKAHTTSFFLPWPWSPISLRILAGQLSSPFLPSWHLMNLLWTQLTLWPPQLWPPHYTCHKDRNNATIPWALKAKMLPKPPQDNDNATGSQHLHCYDPDPYPNYLGFSHDVDYPPYFFEDWPPSYFFVYSSFLLSAPHFLSLSNLFDPYLISDISPWWLSEAQQVRS